MFNLNTPLLFLLFVFTIPQAIALKRGYIVYMGEYSDVLQLTDSLLYSRTDSHVEFLGSILGRTKEIARDAIIYSYRRHINGFAAELDEADVATLLKNPQVVSIFPNEERILETSHSWDFLSLERHGGVIPADSLWTKARFGEDIIIANIDSGVWPESASFDDAGYGPIPKKWKGKCEDDNGSPFPCNRKLIGAKYFYEGFVKSRGITNLTSFSSARDNDGHGTHTLSTAGGNFVRGASVMGIYNGTAKGGIPRARVAAYKVSWPRSCMDADIIKAFDHAIDDGVDVISVSLGGGTSQSYFDNGLSIGAFAANKRGIPVIASAGNDGPHYATVSNVAPWIFTVAASTTDRDIVSYLKLHNGLRLKGKSMTKPTPENRFYPLVAGADAKDANGSTYEASLCRPRALDAEKVKGKILVCLTGEIASATKAKAASLGGAVGMILCNDESYANNIEVEPHLLPAIQVTYTDGLSVFAYINATKNPMGRITSPKAEFGTKPAPSMASFSSRGPNTVTPEILKPDITAPGVEIMAAYTEGGGPTELPSDLRRTKYTFLSGTSMSCPHVAGVVGLLKAVHPKWSPAAIRSALMTTASTVDNTKKPIRLDSSLEEATPFSYGAGHIRPDLAADPGLVYDLSTRDYDNFLCASARGNQTLTMMKFTTCLFANTALNLLNFNYPSITVPKLSTTVKVNRVLKNVGSPGNYVAKIRQPEGVSISVNPNTLKFTHTGQEKRFQLTMTRDTTIQNNTVYLFGELVWSDGRHKVRSPIVVGPA